MAKLNKTYPGNMGMVNRGYNDKSPFEDLVDIQIVKDSMSSRDGYYYLGSLPKDIDIFEMVQVGEDFYEILVTTAKALYVYKNGARVLTKTIRDYTGGPLSFSNLGNVIAIWDKAQAVSFLTPTASAYPREGFIVVNKTLDYGTNIQIQTESGLINFTIGDPLISGQATVDATRGVDEVARTIAKGIGGGGTYANAGEVILAALAEATTYWDVLVESKTKNTPAWDSFTTLANAYAAAAAPYNALELKTPAQMVMQNAYWLSLAADLSSQIGAIDVSLNPTYNSALNYQVRANVLTLTASPEKTNILALMDTRDIYNTNAANALISVDSTGITAAYYASIQAIVNWLNYCYTTWWCGYIEDGDGFAYRLSLMMGPYATAATAFLTAPETRAYAYRGNVVYIPDMRNITIKNGEEYLTLIDGKVTSPLTLPRFAPLGTILKINPIPGKEAATYSMATPNNPSTASTSFLQEVAWEECANQDQAFEWNQATLPALIELVPTPKVHNTAADTTPYWTKKKAGDIDLCPNPLINGCKITDIGRGANRLLILGNNGSLTISELGKKENLFRISTLLLYPTDAFSTSISGEKPTNLYKIAHWGSHIAILGGNSIFKFDLSNSIDATFPKMTRAVNWSGKEAFTAATESDLILVGQEMYALTYGTYGTKVELIPLSAHINLPQDVIKVLYDPTRKNVYLLCQDVIFVGHYVKENYWAWSRLTVPGSVINGWMETDFLRLHCSAWPRGGIIRLPLHPNAILERDATYQTTDALEWHGYWTGGAIPTTASSYATVGQRPGLALTPSTYDSSWTPVVPKLSLIGSEVPGTGRGRLTRCQLKTRGFCEVSDGVLTYSTHNLRNREAVTVDGETTFYGNYLNLTIPVNLAGSITKLDLYLNTGEISGVDLMFIQGKANLGSVI